MPSTTGIDHVSKAVTARRMPQLDGVRALAVLAVLVHHYLSAAWPVLDRAGTSLGFLGVKLFFVLSGFLITGILLEGRLADDTPEGRSRLRFLRQFYIRRFLRIFPLYYVVVALALICNIAPARQIAIWLLTYTVNIYFSIVGEFPRHFSHLWSLAIEEQFYLVWPWCILYARQRHLVVMTALMIGLG